nr:MAG: putative coat protein [Tombusviridae sp.]
MSTKQVNRLINTVNQLRAATNVQPSGRSARRRRRRANNNGNGGAGQVVTAPVARSVVTRFRPPMITSSSGTTIIRNTEKFQSFSSLVAFAATRRDLVPNQFNWLNAIAQSYSKFRWVSLEIIYVPFTSTNTTGNLMMALSYDSTDNLPATSDQLLTYYNAISFPAWAGSEGLALLHGPRQNVQGAISMRVDTNRMEKPWYRYISAADLAAIVAVAGVGTSVATDYIPAQVVTGAEGFAAASGVGNLWARYEIELIEPIAAASNV